MLTGGILTPVILSQRDTIAGLEDQLRAPPAATPRQNISRAARPVPSTAPPRTSAGRRSEYEEQQVRLEPVKDKVTAWTESVMQIEDAERKQKALNDSPTTPSIPVSARSKTKDRHVSPCSSSG